VVVDAPATPRRRARRPRAVRAAGVLVGRRRAGRGASHDHHRSPAGDGGPGGRAHGRRVARDAGGRRAGAVLPALRAPHPPGRARPPVRRAARRHRLGRPVGRQRPHRGPGREQRVPRRPPGRGQGGGRARRRVERRRLLRGGGARGRRRRRVRRRPARPDHRRPRRRPPPRLRLRALERRDHELPAGVRAGRPDRWDRRGGRHPGRRPVRAGAAGVGHPRARHRRRERPPGRRPGRPVHRRRGLPPAARRLRRPRRARRVPGRGGGHRGGRDHGHPGAVPGRGRGGVREHRGVGPRLAGGTGAGSPLVGPPHEGYDATAELVAFLLSHPRP
jgi:hypothetical protein